jgi:hypothetical protein
MDCLDLHLDWGGDVESFQVGRDIPGDDHSRFRDRLAVVAVEDRNVGAVAAAGDLPDLAGETRLPLSVITLTLASPRPKGGHFRPVPAA